MGLSVDDLNFGNIGVTQYSYWKLIFNKF